MSSRLGFSPRRFTNGDEKHDSFARRMWREGIDHRLIEEGQSRGPNPERIRGKVELAGHQRATELCQPVAASAEGRQRRIEIGQKVDVHRRIAAQILLPRQKVRLRSRLFLAHQAQRLERVFRAVIDVGARLQTFDRVDDEVKVVEGNAFCPKRVRGDPARRALEEGGELRQRERLPGEAPGRSASPDDRFDRYGRQVTWFGNGEWFQRSARRRLDRRRCTALPPSSRVFPRLQQRCLMGLADQAGNRLP